MNTKLLYLTVFVLSLTSLTGCQNKVIYASPQFIENFKLIDSYSLFQKNGDLVFSIELKNITDSPIHFDTDVQPFSIYYNYEQRLDAKPYPSFTTTSLEKIVDIKKGGSYSYCV